MKQKFDLQVHKQFVGTQLVCYPLFLGSLSSFLCGSQTVVLGEKSENITVKSRGRRHVCRKYYCTHNPNITFTAVITLL